MTENIEPHIGKTWLAGGNKTYPTKTTVVAIPHNFAAAYDLDKPTNVVITATDKGILISKLEIK